MLNSSLTEIWWVFLQNFKLESVCRPMVNFDKTVFTGQQLNFYSDASTNEMLGFNAIFEDEWLYSRREPGYICRYKPSIEYLELYALTTAVLTWRNKLWNMKIYNIL